ncbi:GAF domain-containing sensor histidine kinase [Algoriphagus sp. AGSA1]|uniref:sensor histidine kinase n=1 Tax=Algoriphagus sp. AGSA1 TaxID=2907213 RepID=UPI001F25315C|nr:ATP-binding protein [Algoriphagus sp. AGSA1]MCE7053258.1 GAF domain-containing sensor histidine kinase [Algoriphagus sp. AGSA1]
MKAQHPTVFENEDLVFDLETRKLLKVSDRLKLHLGEDFIKKIKSLDEYEKLTSSLADDCAGIARSYVRTGDKKTNYVLNWQGKEFIVNELGWIDQSKNSFHLVIHFQDRKNIFEVSYESLLEIVEKMKTPAILFDQALRRALAVNSAIVPLLKKPVSELAPGFFIREFFVYEDQFDEVIAWIKDNKTSSLSIVAKLNLEKSEGVWYEMGLFKTCPDEEVLVLCILKNITKEKETEDRLKRSNELLSRVVEVQSHFLSQSEGANPYDLLLSNILNVIEAKLGFVGKVDTLADGKQALKIHAVTDFSHQGKLANELYHNHLKDNFLFRHLDNLFGACILESKIILENSPKSNPHTKGKYIPGHPQIDNFLGVPIFKGKDVIGLIGLSNKEGGFTEHDIADLKPFITTYSVIIEAFKSEQDKIKFEKESLVKAEILAKIADHSPDLIVVMNDMSDFEFISPSAYQFFDGGVREEEIQRRIRILLKKTLSSEFRMSPVRYRSRLKLDIKSGGECWVESNVNILYEGSKRKVIAVIRDVSSQMVFEQRLVESLKKEKQFNSFVSDFMNIVSHEFKTPLATIISSLELSKHYLDNVPDNPATQKLKDHCGKIERELGNLHKLVIHSLDYERFVNNSPVLKKDRISVVHFVEEVLQRHGLLGQVELVQDMPSDQTVEWDKFLIETCIINLVGNALKYGGDSQRPVVRLFHKNDVFGIEVRDFGLGILEEELPYVFTPFFRGSNVNGIEGTGFGLVAVKNFVQLHGGTVKIDSKPNKGTSVRVSFRQ